MKNTLILITILLLAFSQATATEYFFLGEEDNYYENPANWYPTYPGTLLHKEDTVYLQADVYFEGYNLEVFGLLEVTLGSTINSSSGSMIIQSYGKLNNEGEIYTFAVYNYGIVSNNISASMHLQAYHSYRNSTTNNFLSASFTVIRDVTNFGTINNYGYFTTGQNLENHNTFNHLGHAELSVDHILYIGNGSKINQSTHARVQTGKKVQLSPYSTLVQSLNQE